MCIYVYIYNFLQLVVEGYLTRGSGKSVMGGEKLIFIHLCSASLISFEISCFYNL